MAEPLPDPEGDEYVKVGSGIHGRSLIARVDIPKDTFIIEYRGEKVSRKEGTLRAQKQWEKNRIYVFNLNQRYDLDGAVKGNKARYANHACDPNAEAQNERGRRIWLVATRDIKKGDEITFDYHLPFEEPPQACKCGAKDCIGYIVGPDAYRELRDWMQREGIPVPKRLKRLPRA